MYRHPAATPHNPNPWVLVARPGQDDEDIVEDFPTFAEAHRAMKAANQLDQDELDIMRRRDDGTLTTEF